MSNQDTFRINRQIRARQVRLVYNGKQVGILPTEKALQMAFDAGLDLVEVTHTNPPVCKILDYGKFKYELQIKKKENVKKQKNTLNSLKEIRLRPSIEKHDINVKVSQAKKFLDKKQKVQFNLVFRGARELSHKDVGFNILNFIIKELDSFCVVEKKPKFDGSKITCIVSPI